VHLLHHPAIQLRIWLVHAWRIDEDNLRRRMLALAGRNFYDALNPGPRGLRLRGHNRDLLAGERIQQRALARIRPADDGNKSRSH
jgi:hypothetical protein